jgi:hypothetical protein
MHMDARALGSSRRNAARKNLMAGVVALVGLIGLPSPGRSGPSGFRCPTTGHLVSVGQSLLEVRNRCREPDDASSSVEVRTVREKVKRWARGVAEEVVIEHRIEVPVDEWSYDFGRNRFTQFLRFEYGRLVLVREGSKGTGEPE